MKNYILTFLLLFSVLAQAQETYYVAPDGSDDNAGTSEEDPWATLAFAANEAQELSDGDIVIQVAPGNYSADETIRIDEAVRWVGGFDDEGNGAVVRLAETVDTLLDFRSPGGSVAVRFLTFEGSADNQTAVAVNETATFEAIGNTFQNVDIPIRLAGNLTAIDVSENRLADFTSGIFLENSTNADSLVVRSNSFTTPGTSPDTLAIDNRSADVINAEYNWWGTAENAGELVSDNVDYSPWLASGANTANPALNEFGFAGDLSSIILGGGPSYDPDRNELQEAYNAVETDKLLLVGNIAYDSLIALKSATLLTEANDTVSIDDLVINIFENVGANFSTDSMFVGGSLLVESSLTLTNGSIRTLGDSSRVILGESVDNPEGDNRSLRGTFTTIPRPLGPDEVNILGVNIAAGEPLGDVKITRINGPEGVTSVAGNESIRTKWTIESDQELENDREITFFWRTEDNNNLDTAAAVAWRLVDEQWVPGSDSVRVESIGVGLQTIDFSVSPDELSSTWTVSSINEPLPVTLTDFTAYLDESSVRLRWTTASETNSDYFRAERSTDGFTYEPLGRAKAAGESQRELDYLYVDEGVTNRLSGVVYYRLKMVDFDGSFEYSPAVAVSLSGDAPLLVYANRRGTFKLFADFPETDYTIQVSDMSGQIVYQAPLSAQPDVREYTLPVPPLTSSIYTLRCIGFQDVQVGRFRVE